MESNEMEESDQYNNNNTTTCTVSSPLLFRNGNTHSINRRDENKSSPYNLSNNSKLSSRTNVESNSYSQCDPEIRTEPRRCPSESLRPISASLHQTSHSEVLLHSTGKSSSSSSSSNSKHHSHRNYHQSLYSSRHHHSHRKHYSRYKNNRSPNYQTSQQFDENIQMITNHGRRSTDNYLYNKSSRSHHNNTITNNTSCCSSSTDCGIGGNSGKVSPRLSSSDPNSNDNSPNPNLSPAPTSAITSPLPPPSPPTKSGEHVHCLFPELLVMIFCYLDVRNKGRVAQVCGRWRDAAYSRTVWRGVEAKIHLRRSNPSLFRSLAKRGIRRIQILSLKRSLRDVVAGIPDLESLNLSGCYSITDAGLGQALLYRLPLVSELNLSLCKQTTDYSLSRIAMYLKNLKVLHLGGCSLITNAGLFVISYGLVNLQSLDLRSCRYLSDQGIAYLAGLGNEITTQGNLALEHLCLQDCQKLTDQSLHYMSLGLKNLLKVNLSFCGGVTDAGLQYLAKMPSLREINLASCDLVTDTGLAHLARGGSHITSLDVSFCDKIGDGGLSRLAEGLFKLECLSLSACNISDTGISYITQNMHGLTTLNIGQCHRITDRALNLIADNLKKLSSMDLYGCTQISAKGLERIMQLPSLSSLNLGLWHKR
uniref:Uncharacterized protein n=2 Tax=Octopus bimaculoides TaxID=37653 RepID=A0A0L8FPT6_OCTBM